MGFWGNNILDGDSPKDFLYIAATVAANKDKREREIQQINFPLKVEYLNDKIITEFYNSEFSDNLKKELFLKPIIQKINDFWRYFKKNKYYSYDGVKSFLDGVPFFYFIFKKTFPQEENYFLKAVAKMWFLNELALSYTFNDNTKRAKYVLEFYNNIFPGEKLNLDLLNKIAIKTDNMDDQINIIKTYFIRPIIGDLNKKNERVGFQKLIKLINENKNKTDNAFIEDISLIINKKDFENTVPVKKSIKSFHL